jgi:hypothetical protein
MIRLLAGKLKDVFPKTDVVIILAGILPGQTLACYDFVAKV